MSLLEQPNNNTRMILVEWATIMTALFAGIAFLTYQIYSIDSRMEQRMGLFEQRMNAHEQRIDQLYQNFIDLLRHQQEAKKTL